MNRTAIEEIKKRIPIEELLASYIKIEKAGKSFKAKCPFHNEKSASFFVSPERGGYYCFGCGAKGDIFSFVEQFEGIDFRGALKILAERAGVPLVYDQKADGEIDQLYKIMEEATVYFENNFQKSNEAKEYINKRGVLDKTRSNFRIGWALEGWSNLHDYLKKKGWSDNIIEKAGLAKKGDRGDFYDRFRGRVIFPIADTSGRIIAFSGRILKEDPKAPKYLNSPDTPLYDKSAVLYGLDKAKSEIRRLNYTILVEGQMDLVMSHQAEIKNTVATSGTALADDGNTKDGAINNLGLIRRLSPNVIIAFDSDSAGRKAALRAAGIALGMGMDVKVADIVGGKDPADLIKENISNWREVLKNTKNVIEFELNNVLTEIEDKRKVARALQERVFPLLASIEKQTDQDYFVKIISDKAQIDIGAVWDDLKIIKKRLDSESTKKETVLPKTSSEILKRIDLVERRMFGLLAMMEAENDSQTIEYRDQIKSIAGDSYEERNNRAQSLISDLLFEAESFFGDQKEKWPMHMKELIFNFEEDVLSEKLISTMQELRIAEKNNEHQKVAELAKKCQVISIRKAEILKKRIGV